MKKNLFNLNLLDLNKLFSEAKESNFYQIVVRVFVIYDKNIKKQTLLLRRTWNKNFPNQEEPPGGKVEKGETLIEAVFRELKEETNLSKDKLADLEYMCFFDFEIDKNKKVREFIFKLKAKSKNISQNCLEHTSYRWVNLDEVLFSDMHPSFVNKIINLMILEKL